MIMLEATYVVNLSVTQIIEIKCDSIFNFDKGRIINALNQDRMILIYYTIEKVFICLHEN